MAFSIVEGKNYRMEENVLIKQSTIGEDSSIDRDSVVLQSTIGRHCDIEKRNLVRRANIGDMTYTGADTNILWANIGKYCCISRMVDIGGNEHNYQAASMMPDYRLHNRLEGKLRAHQEESIIEIGNDVWIGSGVSIVRKDGLVIGDGAVIGSGSVVTKSVPPYAIVVGVPARIVKYRFSEDIIKALLQIRWWDWPEKRIVEKWPLLRQNLTEQLLKELVN